MCVVSILRGRGTAYSEIPESAVETDRKENEVMCHLKMFIFCSNYDVVQARGSNALAYHSDVLKALSTRNPAVAVFY